MRSQMAAPKPVKVFITCGVLAALAVALPLRVASQGGYQEAPAAFDDTPNGMVSQGHFNQVRTAFERREEVHTGLGPIYNAQSCAECHASPVTGGISQITITSAGRLNALGAFVPHPGGSLIQSRATDASITETLL